MIDFSDEAILSFTTEKEFLMLGLQCENTMTKIKSLMYIKYEFWIYQTMKNLTSVEHS